MPKNFNKRWEKRKKNYKHEKLIDTIDFQTRNYIKVKTGQKACLKEVKQSTSDDIDCNE